MDDTTEPTEATKTKGGNKLTLLMRLHWKGRLPLVISYWVVGWLLQAVVVLGLLFVAIYLNRTLGFGLLWLGISALLSIAFMVWAYVGVWRSATAYEQASNRPWGTLAKLAVVLSVLKMLYELVVAVR